MEKIIGFPDYRIDIKEGVIESSFGIRRKVDGKRSFSMKRDGVHRRVKWNRLCYAVQHHVDYYDIPSQYYVCENGTIREDMCFYAHEARKERAKHRIEVIDRKMHELEIMRRCYVSGDVSEVTLYIEQVKDRAVGRFCRAFGRSRESGEHYYAAATLRLLARIESSSHAVTAIENGLYGLMSKELRRQKLSVKLYNWE